MQNPLKCHSTCSNGVNDNYYPGSRSYDLKKCVENVIKPKRNLLKILNKNK